MNSASNICCPPDHLVEKFGGTCFHWTPDCPHSSGVANPNRHPPSLATFGSTRPITPNRRPSQASTSHYHWERVSQVQFVEQNADNKVLIDTGVSIHLPGSTCFATVLRDIPPFRIFFANANSSITISQMTTLKIPIQGGHIIICNVPFSQKVLGTILSVRRLCRAGVVPLFSHLKLSLLVNHFVIATTFINNCWWLNIVQNKGTNVSVAMTPSSCLIEMNPISPPSPKSLSLRGWHERLGHACDKVVISFLKQHVLTFDTKQWQPFFCEVCARAKSTHCLARARTDILKEKPLDLLALDVMGPFDTNVQGFRYILTVWDHVSTYSIVYPLKSRSEAPQAIMDCITQLQVRLCTNNAREFTSSSFANALAKVGVSFVPSLPYSPQENGEAEQLNQTLGDMAHAMMTQSNMPTRFWHYTYTLACYIHNRLLNSCCANSSPYQELFGQALAITTIYPFGEKAIVHLPANHQLHKLAPRGVLCKLLKPLMTQRWLLWDSNSDKVIQSESVIFPQFQPEKVLTGRVEKVMLPHILNAMALREDHLGQALASPPKSAWRKACLAELDQMQQRDVWEVVDKTPGMATIGHRWVSDIKRNTNDAVERFKAQMVACGDHQQPGVDCMETYAPTALLMSLLLILVTACLNFWQVSSFDVSGAYLYIPVEETVLIELPTILLPHLKAMEVNQSLYIFCCDQEVIAIWIHVNDGIVTSNLLGAISRFKMALCEKLDIKWSDQLTCIVGLKCVFVLPAGSTMTNMEALHPMPYRSVVGSLAYLVSVSRPDLAFAVNYLARHSMKASVKHWHLLDHMVGYLLKTRTHGMCLGPASLSLSLWSDVGWGGDLERSPSGFILKLGDSVSL
ncbi:hypothetical protein O181_097591 [Austropuccinia psidii MF-1]|uniref:Integrase catalytic domain-containing protein n=1 Tax=Austropuccinia psidii MF-1 TaxID=1389203 RepID=A0A9Q3J996_9BASI|nr:hypothetical protein [Austropuccinia psidii MF-1]